MRANRMEHYDARCSGCDKPCTVEGCDSPHRCNQGVHNKQAHAAVRARREAQTPDSLPGCLAADRARQEVGAAMSGMPKVACPETWEAKTVCNAWGAPSSHGCAKDPGHDGEHRCACGRARREGGQT